MPQNPVTEAIARAIAEVEDQIARLQAAKTDLEQAMSKAGEQPPGAQPGPENQPPRPGI